MCYFTCECNVYFGYLFLLIRERRSHELQPYAADPYPKKERKKIVVFNFYLSVHPSACLSSRPSTHPTINLPIHHSIRTSHQNYLIHPPTQAPAHPSIHPYVKPKPTYPSIHQPTHHPRYPSTHHPSIYLSINTPTIHPPVNAHIHHQEILKQIYTTPSSEPPNTHPPSIHSSVRPSVRPSSLQLCKKNLNYK